jgi:hypothetical protein
MEQPEAGGQPTRGCCRDTRRRPLMAPPVAGRKWFIGHGENDRYDGGHADPDDAPLDDGPATVWVSSPVASAGSAVNPPQQKIFTYPRRAVIQSTKKRLATIVSEKHA